MIETICIDCGTRYRPGTDHVCHKKPTAKKSAPAVKPAPRPRRTDRSGESRKDRAGQAKKSQPASAGDAASSAPKASEATSLEGDAHQVSGSGVASTRASSTKAGRKDTRKGDRHKPGYWKTYQRKDRLK